jgi:hypothetical protein
MDALWPHFRTDAVGTVCLVVALVCLVTGRAPGAMVFALGLAAFCAISPRMEKGFKFSALGLMSLSGTFRKLRKKRSETLEGRDAKLPDDPKVKKRR